MIENLSSRTNIGAVLLRTSRATGSDTPRQWQTDRHNLTNIIPIRPQSWRRTVQALKQHPGGKGKVAERSRNLELTTPHQWLIANNPLLASLVTETIGERWLTHAEDLQQLIPLADDREFQARWEAVKQVNKQIFAAVLYRDRGVKIDADSLFDLQLQPIGDRQRQLLNILHIIALYQRIKQQPHLEIVPRTFIFADTSEFKLQVIEADELGMAPPSIDRAIAMTIESLASTLAADPEIRGKLQVIYLPHATGLTELLYRAADLTEQIAPAGMEDVDPHQLKLSANGALSISSQSNTNHLRQQAVGEDNCFAFGLAIPELALFKEYGYDPYNYYKYYPEIRQAIDALMAGEFTAHQPGIARLLVDRLLGADEQLVLADYVFYRACQQQVSDRYANTAVWTRMSILNVAGIG